MPSIPVAGTAWKSKKECMELINKLEDIGLLEKVPYFYDIFITRDLEFWKYFYQTYAHSIDNDPELEDCILKFNIFFGNVDFIRYLIENELLNNGIHFNTSNIGWLHDLIEEWNEKNGHVEDEPLRPIAYMRNADYYYRTVPLEEY